MRLYRCILSIMRTTITLDDDVYEAAQAHAQATGKRLGQVLSEMARQALQPSERGPKRSSKKASRFPVFEVPADARMIPASRIQKALDEDGIV
jgi:Arc/MetJ family transcription regulator